MGAGPTGYRRAGRAGAGGPAGAAHRTATAALRSGARSAGARTACVRRASEAVPAGLVAAAAGLRAVPAGLRAAGAWAGSVSPGARGCRGGFSRGLGCWGGLRAPRTGVRGRIQPRSGMRRRSQLRSLRLQARRLPSGPLIATAVRTGARQRTEDVRGGLFCHRAPIIAHDRDRRVTRGRQLGGIERPPCRRSTHSSHSQGETRINSSRNHRRRRLSLVVEACRSGAD